MEWLFFTVLAIGIVVTGVFLYFRVKEDRIKAVFTKAAASLCFIATALVAFSLNRDNFEYAILIIFASLILVGHFPNRLIYGCSVL